MPRWSLILFSFLYSFFFDLSIEPSEEYYSSSVGGLIKSLFAVMVFIECLDESTSPLCCLDCFNFIDDIC